MSKRWTEQDLNRLKARGFKVIETKQTVKRSFDGSKVNPLIADEMGNFNPELSEYSLDVPKRGRPKISDPEVVAKAIKPDAELVHGPNGHIGIRRYNTWTRDVVEKINGSVPSKSNCYRVAKTNGHGTLIKSDALKKYEESFMWQCQKYRNKNISTPFEFHVKVYYTSKRPDLDNAMKIILDCLQHVKAIKNDNNCCKIVAEKFIDKMSPRIEFKIIPV